MTWQSPVKYALVQTADSYSFRHMPEGTTGLPVSPHPGAFGVQRRNHVHEGVDIYVPEGTPVFAVETGRVIAVRAFTGPALGHDWWLPTQAVWVEGPSGVVVYGEISPDVACGQEVEAGTLLGRVARVLRTEKGRPTSMLHLELRVPGNTDDIEWLDYEKRPTALLDPTPLLLAVCQASA